MTLPAPETGPTFKVGDLVRGDKENSLDGVSFLSADAERRNVGVLIKRDEVYMVIGGVVRKDDNSARIYYVLTPHGVLLTGAVFIEKV